VSLLYPSTIRQTGLTGSAKRPQPATRDRDLEVVPMTADGAVHARNAYRQFGKGVGTPGVLNYGDCLSYGVARQLGDRLLFKGDDFPRTDVAPAEY
jgi:ribonuclease VapC